MSKTYFYKSPLGGPCKHLGGQRWAHTALLGSQAQFVFCVQ